MVLQDSAPLLLGLLLLFQPWGAWAAVEVNMEDKVEVFLGKTAQITCLFTSDDGIGAMIMQWFYVTRSSEKQRIYYQDATMKIIDRGTPYSDRISVNGSAASGEVVMTINNVQLEDETEFICLIKSLTDGIAEGRTSLKVFVAPQLPTIEAAESGISVIEDDLSKIGSCEVKNGYPKPNVTWYKNHMPLRNKPDMVDMVSSITTESSGLLSVTSELRMRVVKEDKEAQFYCEVTYLLPGGTGMTETSNISVNVYYPHDALNMWVASPSGKIKEGDTMEIHCSGNGNSPSSIISIKHEESGSSWDTETLVLSNVTRLNGGVYECESFDMDTAEVISHNISVFIHYLGAAAIEPKETLEVPQGGQLKATCNALASLQTDTAWFKDGEEVSKGHILIVDDVTFDSSGTYKCVVTVPEIEGMMTSGSLQAFVEGPPQIMEQDSEMESYESSVQLKCHAKGYPAPEMSWTTSDGKVTSTTPTETEEGYESVYTVQFTSNITAVCRASNQHGAASVTFSIKATAHTTPPTPATTTTITAPPTTPPTTTTTTTTPTTTPTTTTTTTVHATVKTETSIPPKRIRKESNGVIIAVIIICILLLAILGSVLYFLYKKGKICGRSGKQDLTKEKSGKDNIVVEMKSDNTEEAILLGVNGEKLTPTD